MIVPAGEGSLEGGAGIGGAGGGFRAAALSLRSWHPIQGEMFRRSLGVWNHIRERVELEMWVWESCVYR